MARSPHGCCASLVRAHLLALGLGAATVAQAPLQFASALLPNAGFPLATDTKFGDFDADGDEDLLLVSTLGPKLYRNDGNGTFTDVSGLLPVFSANLRAACFVDLDGDRRRDLLLTWRQQPRLFRSMPDGSWLEVSQNLPAGLPTINAAVAVDVDGDGDEDLACAGHFIEFGANQLLTNLGNGTFAASQPFAGSAFQLFAADVDADGDADLVTLRDGMFLWRNEGGGLFADVTATQLPAGLGAPTAAAAGDLDGDGLVDMLLGASALGDVVLRNTGGGTFGTVFAPIPQGQGATHTVALADVDCDGDLDWPRGTINFGPATLFLNTGTLAFADASTRLPAVASLAVQARACDLDGDGDPDLVLTGLGVAPQVLWNLHRHVAVAAPPAVGGTCVLELASQPGYGLAGRYGILGIGLGRLDPMVAIPPLGRLGLDLALPVVQGVAAYGAGDGVVPFMIAVPALPQLVGVRLYVQGLVDEQPGGSPRFTALWETVVQ